MSGCFRFGCSEVGVGVLGFSVRIFCRFFLCLKVNSFFRESFGGIIVSYCFFYLFDC